MNLARYSAYWARLRADKPAIRFKGETTTWAELDRRASAVAAALQKMGVSKGDRVGCLLTNCPEWPITYIGALRIGAILVPLNPRFGDAELQQVEAQVACRVVVSNPEFIRKLKPQQSIDGQTPGASYLYADGVSPKNFYEAATSEAVPTPVDIDPADIAIISFTSGSTGLPKGVMLAHDGIGAFAHSQIVALGLNSEDRVLLLAPFAFTGGVISAFTPNYVVGGCTQIEDAFDPMRALKLLAEDGITSLTAVPILFEAMAGLPGFEAADLSRLRTAITGGAPVSQTLLQRYLKKGVTIRQVYGCTEGCGLLALPTPENAIAKPWSCGDALPTVDIRLVNAEEQACKADEPGEILIKGIQVMRGYWNRPEENDKAWIDGWYRTGDMGVRDADGHLKIVDRKKNMIITGGVNVYPAEVERAMAGLGGIAEVLVFGRPDAKWGETVVAVVHGPKAEVAQSLFDASRQLLGDYKAPKELIVSPAPLPKTTTGKISRQGLDAYYASLESAPRARSKSAAG